MVKNGTAENATITKGREGKPKNESRLPLRETLNTLPPEWPEDLSGRIRTMAHESSRKVVVLDDDPTGT